MDTKKTTSRATEKSGTAGLEHRLGGASESKERPEASEGAMSLQRYDQVAKAASAGIMSHPQVESAIVEISGPPGLLIFHLHCALISDNDPSCVMEHISEGLIPDVEKILGQEFASRDLNFTVTPPA